MGLVLRILQVSDTHLRAPGADVSGRTAPDIDPAARLDTVLAAVAATGFVPDAVVHTGDIADDGSPEGTGAVWERLRAIAPVVVGVPGNHDDPTVVGAIFGRPVAHLGAWRIGGVDTSIPREVAGRVDPLIALLENPDELVAPGAEPEFVLLAMHHPLRSRSTHEWFVLPGAGGAEEAVTRHTEVRGVLSGHTHEAFEATLASGARLLGGPATYYGIAHSGLEFTKAPGTAGARLLDLHDDGRIDTWVVPA